jgi:Fanconi anemia group M protein
MDVLVATCIAEEGLDIPNVDLVIFYEPIPSEIRYIQRKGRTGRKAPGKAIILAAKNTYDAIYLYSSKRRVERMRIITRNMNQKLKSLIRFGPKLERDMLSSDEIKDIEKERETGNSSESNILDQEENELKKLTKETEKAAKIAYMNILHEGEKGILIDDLKNKIHIQNEIQSETVNLAIDKLRREGLIGKVDHNRLFPSAFKRKKKSKLNQNDFLNIRVEKVLQGSAVVWIDDKWRARLTPDDFEGPPKLIKKNAEFTVRGTLYRENDTLCIRIKEIVEIN